MKYILSNSILLAVIFLLSCFLVACGGSANVMQEAYPQKIHPPRADKAQIIFMRSTFVTSTINSELFDVTDGKIQFLGSIPNGNKIKYDTAPGEKVFMAYGNNANNADFLKANIEAGKTYYVFVQPSWKTGKVSLRPIKNKTSTEYNVSASKFKDWLHGTTLITADEKRAQAWYSNNKLIIEKVYKESWQEFQAKPEAQIAAQTIQPDDGLEK